MTGSTASVCVPPMRIAAASSTASSAASRSVSALAPTISTTSFRPSAGARAQEPARASALRCVQVQFRGWRSTYAAERNHTCTRARPGLPIGQRDDVRTDENATEDNLLRSQRQDRILTLLRTQGQVHASAL